ncbi:hypothetical protein GGX14DRAFT_631030 [Mycena pura]|uniref:Uncharacterized protein n=1 Tax=Mycena pura TaxID=153505 RepID=A0AAD6VEC5_9AGAR|nr:hypothetical protein GGX14DRAFT_631030 [Mycena pura]
MSQFETFLAHRYGSVKAQFPGEGRRKWVLRVVEEFFASDTSLGTPTVLDNADILKDADPFDDLGLLIRTDFSNEDAWSSFCERLKAEEEDFIQSVEPSTEDVEMDDNGEDDSDSSSENGIKAPIVKIINPTSDQDRALLENLSNLGALRIFDEAYVHRATSPPAGTKRISPPNRLIDRNGWQEAYRGIYLWIYDAQSNIDQCARVVMQGSDDTYPTHSGDSWRARVTHIIELQSKIACNEMTISFGGLDRYDYKERRRNMDEAER